MYRHEIDQDAYNILDYAERYINIGSPSGFGVSAQLDITTDPFSNRASFRLLRTTVESFSRYEDIGNVGVLSDEREFFVHPLMKSLYRGLGCSFSESILVQPTSSGRTVVTRKRPRRYIKLHFDATLGRVNRAQTYTKAVAGVEVGGILTAGLQEAKLPEEMGLLEEVGARVVWHADGATSSYIERRPEFLFKNRKSIKYALPYFSLFSRDCKSPKVLASILPGTIVAMARRRVGDDPESFFFKLLIPIILTYFMSVRNLGLQIEFNAQNLLVVFDESLSPLGFVLRDFSGVEKDVGFESKFWPKEFRSSGYKFISPSDSDYRVRHSFSFDSKLGDYVVRPVLDLIWEKSPSKALEVLNGLRQVVQEEARKLPEDYFPEGIWYSHPKMLLTGDRPYVENLTPLLR